MNDLSGKRALVTGGSRGIGAAIALALAARGADVAITYERSADRAHDVVKAIQGGGRRGLAIQADSADQVAVKRSISATVSEFGGLDILVNNAGIFRYGDVVDMSITDIDALLDVNVRAALIASQAAIPHLGEGGRIVSIGSCLAERVPLGGSTVYAMTKSALLAFTRGLARELGPKGITVNLVQPGATDTEMNPADGVGAPTMRALTALGRHGTTAEVAAVVAFLASPSASLVTGSVVTADAGANA